MGLRSVIGGLALLGLVTSANAVTPNAPIRYKTPPHICAKTTEKISYDELKLRFNGPINPENIVESLNPQILPKNGYNADFDRISLSNVPATLIDNYVAELQTHPEVCFSSPQSIYRPAGQNNSPVPYPTENLDISLAADLQNTAEHRLWADNLVRNLPPNLTSINGNQATVQVLKGTAQDFATWYRSLPEVQSARIISK